MRFALNFFLSLFVFNFKLSFSVPPRHFECQLHIYPNGEKQNCLGILQYIIMMKMFMNFKHAKIDFLKMKRT